MSEKNTTIKNTEIDWRQEIMIKAKKNVISRAKKIAIKNGSTTIDSDEFTLETINLAKKYFKPVIDKFYKDEDEWFSEKYNLLKKIGKLEKEISRFKAENEKLVLSMMGRCPIGQKCMETETENHD